MATRVKYSLLGDGRHSVEYIDNPNEIDPGDGMYCLAGQKDVPHNGIVEVEDLNDPKSRRAWLVRRHLEGLGKEGESGSVPKLCVLLEEKPKKGAEKN
jgi:hypothetical protein